MLASLPRPDRVEQIRWMHEAVRRRFGVDARGLWLTERVWEPELAADLADAGVRYALVDDRHFLVTGFAAEQLHAPFWTESDGKRVALFPIDERLRYLIPFRPPEETADYLRELRGAGHRLAVLADDGEKFGGWPGTKEWVYEQGLARPLHGDDRRAGRTAARCMLSRLDDALDAVPSGGLAYLPTASYREMEGWSLPPDAALRLARLERDLGEARIAGPDGALIRGAHWRNFLVKYSESNRMHKKMHGAERALPPARRPAAARRAIGRAQCNDAYWHGVFGGLYLPHLRDAIWRNLAEAEAELRRGEGLAWRRAGLRRRRLRRDLDPLARLLRHREPRAGRRASRSTRVFATGVNYANALTRRREAYHDLALERRRRPRGPRRRRARPAFTTSRRASGSTCARRSTPTTARCSWTASCREAPRWRTTPPRSRGPMLSWARTRCAYAVERRKGGVEIACTRGRRAHPAGEADPVRRRG